MGQPHLCAGRVYDAFATKLKSKMSSLKVGRGTDAGVTIGPLIDEQGLAKVEAHLADAIAKGAKVETGGKRHALGGRLLRADGCSPMCR